MTRSVYVIGGAGTGKSTFMQQLLDRMELELGWLQDIHKTPNSRGSLVTLRGHELLSRTEHGSFKEVGMYLGQMRDNFPGTDGLDRVCGITGEEWLRSSLLPPLIVAEGATLATRRFLNALNEHTELMLVHLVADEMVVDLRCLNRGSAQDPSFIKATATRAANLMIDIRPSWIRTIDSGVKGEWESGLQYVEDFLEA